MSDQPEPALEGTPLSREALKRLLLLADYSLRTQKPPSAGPVRPDEEPIP